MTNRNGNVTQLVHGILQRVHLDSSWSCTGPAPFVAETVVRALSGPYDQVDPPCRGAYTGPVTRRDSILAAVLAVGVTFAGTACACAIPSMDLGGVDSHHHAHHVGDSGNADANADHCVHADCQGDCGIDATTAERDAGNQVPKSPFDDGVLVAAMPVAVLPARLPSYHSPPPQPWRRADTPVRRFDILLN